MELMEKMVESKIVYNGIIVTVRVDQAELINGKVTQREVVAHPGGVAILPLADDGTVHVVRQYRYPLGRVMTELPAGKLEYGEDHRLCALRELEEEVGITPDRLTYLGCIYPSPGITDEVLHMYLAQGLSQGTCHPDEDEFLEIDHVPLSALVAQIMAGEVTDAKTVAAVLKAKLYLGL